ncbi:MAG: VCBS repeat-containing protein [Myxococcota bacterium]
MPFSIALTALTAAAAPWEHVDDPVVEGLGGWTQDVDLADVDADGDLDVLLANGGGYSSAGTPEPSHLLLNDGTGAFTDVPLATGLHRVARARDFDGDGVVDLFFAGAWQTPSVLLLGDGAGGWVDASDRLPTDPLSVGDAEPGDVDDDGDLDLVLSDSGEGNALFGPGEVTRLWLNDGTAHFVDATAQLPQVRVGWSWDLELADIDGDHDLDLLVSCKTCSGSFLFDNDGTGTFADRSAALPQRSNNYDFEALDLTGDGLPDLATINDGRNLDERILVNVGTGFEDQTAARLPDAENLGKDDNALVFVDADGDGDIDVLIGSLTDPDRLLVNDGLGNFTVDTDVLTGPSTPGTLGIAVGDLDGDGRLDLVMGQGEAAFTDRWYRGVDVPVDVVAPSVALEALAEGALPAVVHAEVDDRKAPVTPDDAVVTLRWGGGSRRMQHSGHVVWRAETDGLPAAGTVWVCAVDRAGNEACTAPVAYGAAGDTGTTDTATTPSTTPGTTTSTTEPTTPADGPPPSDEAHGCGCDGAGAGAGGGWLAALALLYRRRRRQ